MNNSSAMFFSYVTYVWTFKTSKVQFLVFESIFSENVEKRKVRNFKKRFCCPPKIHLVTTQ